MKQSKTIARRTQYFSLFQCSRATSAVSVSDAESLLRLATSVSPGVTSLTGSFLLWQRGPLATRRLRSLAARVKECSRHVTRGIIAISRAHGAVIKLDIHERSWTRIETLRGSGPQHGMSHLHEHGGEAYRDRGGETRRGALV